MKVCSLPSSVDLGAMRKRLAWILAASCLLALDVNGSDADADCYWPQWRGPLGSGVAPHADPPLEWSESQSIRWKVALPGKGHSTPVIWGDRVFATTAFPYGEAVKPRYSGAFNDHDETPVTQRHRFVVMALSRSPARNGYFLIVYYCECCAARVR